MTGPGLYTSVFSCFYMVIQGVYSLLYCQNPYFHIECLFTKIQSNIAIWQYIAIHSNTIRNTALTHIVSPYNLPKNKLAYTQRFLLQKYIGGGFIFVAIKQ